MKQHKLFVSLHISSVDSHCSTRICVTKYFLNIGAIVSMFLTITKRSRLQYIYVLIIANTIIHENKLRWFLFLPCYNFRLLIEVLHESAWFVYKIILQCNFLRFSSTESGMNSSKGILRSKAALWNFGKLVAAWMSVESPWFFISHLLEQLSKIPNCSCVLNDVYLLLVNHLLV